MTKCGRSRGPSNTGTAHKLSQLGCGSDGDLERQEHSERAAPEHWTTAISSQYTRPPSSVSVCSASPADVASIAGASPVTSEFATRARARRTGMPAARTALSWRSRSWKAAPRSRHRAAASCDRQLSRSNGCPLSALQAYSGKSLPPAVRWAIHLMVLRAHALLMPLSDLRGSVKGSRAIAGSRFHCELSVRVLS